ncbi:hypothetical protein [Spiroplasma poulsonii]|uniref:hypothetical protein n=1 Tax=Spiroplasma poulsonii TaxID=2138 RepID=UPI001F4C71E1|nr:hypothetical protein [Spiroplasma poulsonii]UNF61160.1 hypothetical protein MNU24_04380 [Spiroplasma poulsonii]
MVIMLKIWLYPLELINNNLRNKYDIKNTGKNDKKLWNSRIRTQGNFIRKAYENFWNCKNLGFLTLTYAVNETDIKNVTWFNEILSKY